MKIGSFEILHMETVKAESYVVFKRNANGQLERALQFGKRGGFTTMQAAQEAVTNTVRFGTVGGHPHPGA